MNLARMLSLLLIGLFAFLTFVPMLPPILIELGLETPAKIIYTIFIPFCHQKASRSIHLHDYQFAVCTRDIFIFLSFFITSVVAYLFKLKPLSWKFIVLLTIPIAINGGYQFVTQILAIQSGNPTDYAETTNLYRMITGTLFATGIGLAAFPYIFNDLRKDSKLERPKFFENLSKRKIFNDSRLWIIYILIINFIIYIILCTLWLVTSDTYKPSGIIDNIARIPGLNYEVEGRGDHAIYLFDK